MARRWTVPDLEDAPGNTSPRRQIIFPKRKLLEEGERKEEAGEVYPFPNISSSALQDLGLSALGHQQLLADTSSSATLQTSLHSGSSIEGKSFKFPVLFQ